MTYKAGDIVIYNDKTRLFVKEVIWNGLLLVDEDGDEVLNYDNFYFDHLLKPLSIVFRM